MLPVNNTKENTLFKRNSKIKMLWNQIVNNKSKNKDINKDISKVDFEKSIV